MRKIIFKALTEDPTLASLLPAEKWFERGAVKDSPVTPFAVLAWAGVTANGRGRTGLPRLTLWVYEHRGSYELIDKVLRRATEVLEALEETHQEDDPSQFVIQADFEGSSVDLYDDVYRCNTRNAGYRVIGSGL